MNRTTVLVLIAVGAALAGFAFSTNARRDGGSDVGLAGPQVVAAGEQTAALGWREVTGEPGEQLVFHVEEFEVLRDGWRVELSFENDTSASIRVMSTQRQPFGLMVLSTGDYEEFEQMARDDELPAVRPAVRYDPRPPALLEPGDSWAGVISAPGALVAGSWMRVVFGGLVSLARPNESMAWITDHTHRIQP